jgi:hypothetical protein
MEEVMLDKFEKQRRKEIAQAWNSKRINFIEKIMERVKENDFGNLLNEVTFFGSETEDNISCGQNIFVKKFDDDGRKVIGLSVKNYSVSEILNNFEGTDIPKSLKKQYPKLTQTEWDAITHLTTLIFCAFEKYEEEK